MGTSIYAVEYKKVEGGNMSHEAGNYLSDALGVNDETVIYFINDETAPEIEKGLIEAVAGGKISNEAAEEVRAFLAGIKPTLDKDGATDLSFCW